MTTEEQQEEPLESSSTEVHFEYTGDAEPGTISVLYDQAKLIEAETVKEMTGLLTKVAAGFAGLFGISAAVIGARDTLFWRLDSDNQLASCFIPFEAIAAFGAIICLLVAYWPRDAKMGIEITNNVVLNSFAKESEREAKARLIRDIQENVKENSKHILARNVMINRAFICLLALLAMVLCHTVYSSKIKTEVEKQEKAGSTTDRAGGKQMAGTQGSSSNAPKPAPPPPVQIIRPQPSSGFTLQKGAGQSSTRQK